MSTYQPKIFKSQGGNRLTFREGAEFVTEDGVGAKAGSAVAVEEQVLLPHRTVLTLTAQSITMTDAGAAGCHGSQKPQEPEKHNHREANQNDDCQHFMPPKKDSWPSRIARKPFWFSLIFVAFAIVGLAFLDRFFLGCFGENVDHEIEAMFVGGLVGVRQCGA